MNIIETAYVHASPFVTAHVPKFQLSQWLPQSCFNQSEAEPKPHGTCLQAFSRFSRFCGFKKEKKLFNSSSGFLSDNLYKFVYKIHLPSSGKPESFSLTALRILCL